MKRRVSGIDEGTGNLIMKLVMAYGAYVFIAKPILIKLGIMDDATEQQQHQNDQAAANAQKDLINEAPVTTRNYTDPQLRGIAVAMRTATNSRWSYDYHLLFKELAYFAGFRKADARYFLGVFVDANGSSVYQWWVDKFEDAWNDTFDYYGLVYWQTGAGGTGENIDYRPHYAKYGVTEDNWRTFNYDRVVKAAITYLYNVAGVAMQ